MRWDKYRGWFLAAAVYNLVWGATNVLFPRFIFDLIGVEAPSDLAYWKVVGMMVLVYAPAYWWAARDPFAHRHLIVIALLGKVLGPLGFAMAVISGQIPAQFFWVILTNDLIWWPAFFSFLSQASKEGAGWLKLLRGE